MYCYDRSVGAVTESVHGNVICNVTSSTTYSSTTYILLQSVGGENHYHNLETDKYIKEAIYYMYSTGHGYIIVY